LPTSILHPLSSLQKWASFVRFSHTIFALPFALGSMVLAARENKGWPGWRTFLLILGAAVCARTAAMAFNRIVDRHFDAQNPRTAKRHLPAGAISLASAWTLWVLAAAGFGACSCALNSICFALFPVALIVICGYSLTKRFTDFTHVFLGIALALAPMGAWLAVRGSFDFTPVRDGFLLPLTLAVAVVFWLIGFDIIYALQDYEFDRTHGLHSLVVRWGPKNALRAAFLSHVFLCFTLIAFGLLANFRVPYAVGFGIILVSLLMEHWLAWRRSLNWINLAFFRLNALISVVFLVVVVTEVVFPGFRWRK
jgi:4-hydroxybenzoate polyprenyltransferase